MSHSPGDIAFAAILLPWLRTRCRGNPLLADTDDLLTADARQGLEQALAPWPMLLTLLERLADGGTLGGDLIAPPLRNTSTFLVELTRYTHVMFARGNR